MTFTKLDEAFEITPEVKETQVLAKSIKKQNNAIVISNKEEEREKDYNSVRSNIILLINRGQEVIEGAMEAAESSGHPRAYEVCAAAIKNVADVTDKLIDLHKKIKDLAVDDAPTTVQNNLFMAGTTADLMKMIKEGNKNSK